MEYSQIKPLAWRLVKELIKRPSREEETHRKSTVSRAPTGWLYRGSYEAAILQQGESRRKQVGGRDAVPATSSL